MPTERPSDAEAALQSVVRALRYASLRVSVCPPGVYLDSPRFLSLLSSVRDGQTELDAALTRLVMHGETQT